MGWPIFRGELLFQVCHQTITLFHVTMMSDFWCSKKKNDDDDVVFLHLALCRMASVRALRVFCTDEAADIRTQQHSWYSQTPVTAPRGTSQLQWKHLVIKPPFGLGTAPGFGDVLSIVTNFLLTTLELRILVCWRTFVYMRRPH